jgi:hypothetical protein
VFTIVAALSLETPAPTECAWVLWLSSEYAYTPLDSFKTREQCGSGIEVAKEMTKVRTGQATVLCLPDTVDPRGPRRK